MVTSVVPYSLANLGFAPNKDWSKIFSIIIVSFRFIVKPLSIFYTDPRIRRVDIPNVSHLVPDECFYTDPRIRRVPYSRGTKSKYQFLYRPAHKAGL